MKRRPIPRYACWSCKRFMAIAGWWTCKYRFYRHSDGEKECVASGQNPFDKKPSGVILMTLDQIRREKAHGRSPRIQKV